MSREQSEVLEVSRLFPSSRVLSGPRIEVEHRGFLITARFAPGHPLFPPHLYLSPGVVSSHYYTHQGEIVPRLCWCQPSEWFPRMRLIVAVMAAMRFLNEYVAGRAR